MQSLSIVHMILQVYAGAIEPEVRAREISLTKRIFMRVIQIFVPQIQHIRMDIAINGKFQIPGTENISEYREKRRMGKDPSDCWNFVRSSRLMFAKHVRDPLTREMVDKGGAQPSNLCWG